MAQSNHHTSPSKEPRKRGYSRLRALWTDNEVEEAVVSGCVVAKPCQSPGTLSGDEGLRDA